MKNINYGQLMRSKKYSYKSKKSKKSKNSKNSGPRDGLVGAPSHPSICLTPVPLIPTLWCSLSVLCSRWTPKPLLGPYLQMARAPKNRKRSVPIVPDWFRSHGRSATVRGNNARGIAWAHRGSQGAATAHRGFPPACAQPHLGGWHPATRLI